LPARTSLEPDYVIVGAGSAGCTVVNRLSADPSVTVLLVEAGASGESDPEITTPGRWASLIGSTYDWGYSTESEAGLDLRRLDFPRGRALGGSSAINAMVHIRGHRLCFDRWRAAGNPGWGYDDLLPLFKRSERNEGGASQFRGDTGPLAVTCGHDPHAAHEAFLRSAEQCGFRADGRHDFNGPEPDGVAGFFQKNILNGRRHSAAAAFLLPAMNRPNVTVRSRAQVTRLLVEGRRVVGVELMAEDRREEVRCAREVVLSAGAVDSPKLLMLSGFGPADVLGAHRIPVVADLPGVGGNLQDHLKLSVRWKGRTRLPGSAVTAGLFASSGAAFPADLQFYVGRGLAQPDDDVVITVSLVRPRSRGSITLRSADPMSPPVIRPRYLETRLDADALVRGLQLARSLGRAPAFDALRADELEPGPGLLRATDLERFVRQKADTIYHAAGTCRMGPDSDPNAVVDASLRVHGVEGVRVADASIMPEAVNAPTHAACVVIGEKCAALLAARRG
jgi:choline dehydrogenase